MTYWSAVVDESDLCCLGGIPGQGLREVFGVWEEESQSYYEHESVGIKMTGGNALGQGKAPRTMRASRSEPKSTRKLARAEATYGTLD